MIVVIAVIAMVLARTVRREGKTIGTLMALGYRKSELIRHYMAYGMIPAVAGDILGVLFCIPFSRMFCGFFFGDAEYIAYEVKIPWGLLAVALLLPLVVYGLVSYLVLCGVLTVEIIPLLKGIHQEKTPRILNGSQAKLGVIYNIRTVCVNRFRSITLVIGIAVATLCIVLGGAFQDAYADLLEKLVTASITQWLISSLATRHLKKHSRPYRHSMRRTFGNKSSLIKISYKPRHMAAAERTKACSAAVFLLKRLSPVSEPTKINTILMQTTAYSLLSFGFL